MKKYIEPQLSLKTLEVADIITFSFNVTDVSGGDEISYDALLNNGNDLILE